MSLMRVKSVLDSKDYKKGIKEMQRENNTFGGGLGKIGPLLKKAFAVGAIIAVAKRIATLTKSLIDFGSKLSDVAAQTGVAVERLQLFQDAARNAGAAPDKMTKALISLKDAQGEVLTGDKLMTDAFKNLGISAEEVASKNTDELFLMISQRLTESGNSARELSATFDILGKRNAAELTEAMNELAGGIDNVARSTAGLTTFQAQQLDVLADKWERFKNRVKSGAAGIVADIFGASESVTQEVQRRMETEFNRNIQERKRRQEELAALREGEREKEAEEQRKASEKIAEGVKRATESVKIQIETDQIRRIGGFAGARVTDELRNARMQTEILMQQTAYLESLPSIERNTQNKGLA